MSEQNYRIMRSALAQFERPVQQLNGRELEQAREQAEKERAIEQLILRSAEASAVQVSEAQIEQAMAQIMGRFTDVAEFDRALAENGLDRESMASAIAQELRVNGALERVAEEVPEVTEQDIRYYYTRNFRRFWHDELRTLRHILVTVNADFAENERSRAYESVAALTEQLQRATPPLAEEFARLAQRYSECPSALHDGLIGSVPSGQLYPELDGALFAMAEGEVRGPIETQMGFHVAFCESIKASGLVPLEQVRDEIRAVLYKQRGERAKREWVRALRAQ